MRLSEIGKINFKKWGGSFVLALFALSNAGCGQNLGDAFGRTINGSTSSASDSGSPRVIPANLWAGVDTQGTASNFLMGTHQLFSIDTVNQLLIFHIPIPGMPFGLGSFPLNEIPGATISFTTSGIDFTIPLKDLAKGFNFANPTTLPNGMPLPGVPGGELPRLGGTIQNSNFSMEVYGSVKYFAVFVPVPQIDKYLSYINLIGGELTIPIKNKGGTKILGYFSAIAPVGSFDGGFYVSLQFPPELSAVLDTLFP